MTIVNTIIARGVQGNKRYVYGKSVLSGSADNGEVVTGLRNIDMFFTITKGTTAKAVAVNEEFPLASGTVTAYTESNDATFFWKAEGE